MSQHGTLPEMMCALLPWTSSSCDDAEVQSAVLAGNQHPHSRHGCLHMLMQLQSVMKGHSHQGWCPHGDKAGRVEQHSLLLEV